MVTRKGDEVPEPLKHLDPKVATEGELIAHVDCVLSWVQSRPTLRKFLEKTIGRLEDLRRRASSSLTRIAIVGITSSGKSTLMNAVLGYDLLPTEVGPSTGSQVVCGYDDVLHADIIFEEESGKDKLIIRDRPSKINEALDRYGNEKLNKHNRERVAEIHVFSPRFRFDHDLIIIDTPGLDAEGLAYHEKITLQNVLPTVDMVMFLTTAKCDSDKTNLGFIDETMSDEKLLVVVQNKIDAVEAKLAKRDGKVVVVKTVAEERQSHRERVGKLLQKAACVTVRGAPVVQVAARLGWEQSNLSELGKVVSGQIQLNAKYRTSRYGVQFERELLQCRDALSAVLGTSENARKSRTERMRDLNQWKKGVEGYEGSYTLLCSEIEKQLAAVDKQAEKLIESLQRTYGRKSRDGTYAYENPTSMDSSILSAKSKFETSVNSVSATFSDGIRDLQTKAKSCCKDLNLEFEQIVKLVTPQRVSVVVSECTKTDEKTIRHPARKKSGFGNKLKRGLGWFCGTNWGYTDPWEEKVKVTIFDIAGQISEIKSAMSKLQKAFAKQMPEFQAATEYSIGRLNKEIAAREDEIEDQNNVQLPPNDVKWLVRQIETVVGPCSSESVAEAPVVNVELSEHVEEEVLVEFDGTALERDLCQLAQCVSYDVHRVVVAEMVKRSQQTKVVVAGWECNRLQTFDALFFGDLPHTLVDFNSEGFSVPDEDVLLFLLVNAGQSGSAARRIFARDRVGKYLKSVTAKGKIVWVMDSVAEHLSGGAACDSLIEAFCELTGIAKRLVGQDVIFDVMACDPHLLYTVLFHELLFNPSLMTMETARQNFVGSMSKLFKLDNAQRHLIGHYLKDYEFHMKGAGEDD